MTEDAALFAAALAHPGEDTPRLILADWFDENGEPELARALRSVPEVVPFLSDLVRWDMSPARPVWQYRDRTLVEASDVLPAAQLLLRYRTQFPSPQDAPMVDEPDRVDVEAEDGAAVGGRLRVEDERPAEGEVVVPGSAAVSAAGAPKRPRRPRSQDRTPEPGSVTEHGTPGLVL